MVSTIAGLQAIAEGLETTGEIEHLKTPGFDVAREHFPGRRHVTEQRGRRRAPGCGIVPNRVSIAAIVLPHGGLRVGVRFRRIGLGLVVLAVLGAVGTGGVSLYVGWHLTHPARRPIRRTPAALGLPFHRIRFASRVDHLRLRGWLLPARGRHARGLVIEAHGYKENRDSEPPSLPVAAALHRAGFTVLMFDFRDEGRSPGREVTVGLYEQRDLLGAVDYARKLGYRRIGIIGYSMGASTALEVAGTDPAVRAVVADSPYADLSRLLRNHLTFWSHLPAWPFTPEIIWELRTFLGLHPGRADPLHDLRHAGKLPILLIAGTADRTVPVRNSHWLYRELEREHDPNAKLWIVRGAKHVGAYLLRPKAYLHRVTGFFHKYLGRPGSN